MKKTLIAVAVVASAVVSGSAIASAWSENTFGGDVTFGGTLTPATRVLPWEAQVGGAVSGLDAKIEAGKNFVYVPVTKTIPILGIRTKESKAFRGQVDVTPFIDFHSAVDVSGFDKGTTTLTLPVTDEHGKEIGSMVVPFTSAGVASWKDISTGKGGAANIYGSYTFNGGIGLNEKAISLDSYELAKSIISDVADNFDPQGFKVEGADWISGRISSSTYSGFYAGGILSGKNMTINLKKTPTMDTAIVWKASLPVTVSYQ
ncbi:fimbrial protein [Escherichia albertii]|nr:fimbrial protein [Escherichia albertii]